MIRVFESPRLRKHLGVSLSDLLQTERMFTAVPGQPGLRVASQAPAFRRG